MDQKTVLAQNLKRLREDANLTQDQLAELCGVSRFSVTRWESGRAVPEADNIEALVKALKCTTNDIYIDQSINEPKRIELSQEAINAIKEETRKAIKKYLLWNELSDEEKDVLKYWRASRNPVRALALAILSGEMSHLERIDSAHQEYILDELKRVFPRLVIKLAKK